MRYDAWAQDFVQIDHTFLFFCNVFGVVFFSFENGL